MLTDLLISQGMSNAGLCDADLKLVVLLEIRYLQWTYHPWFMVHILTYSHLHVKMLLALFMLQLVLFLPVTVGGYVYISDSCLFIYL